MADAKPSGPGRNVVVADVRRVPEVNLKKGQYIVKLDDGRTVFRTVMNTGNVVQSVLADGEYPNTITEKKFDAEFKKLTGGSDNE